MEVGQQKIGWSGGGGGTAPSGGTIVGVIGNGALNRVAKFVGDSTIGDSQIFDNGTFIGFNIVVPIVTTKFGVKSAGNTVSTWVTKFLNVDDVEIFKFSDNGRLTFYTADGAKNLIITPRETTGGTEIISTCGLISFYDVDGEYQFRTSGGAGRALLFTNGLKFSFSATSGGAPNMTISTVGNVGVGTDTPDAIAILDCVSNTKGVMFPRMTTAERNAITTTNKPALTVYDTTIDGLFVTKNDGTWLQL